MQFVVKRKPSRIPPGIEAMHPPPPSREHSLSERGTIDVISGGFASGGETCDAGEVYAADIPTGVSMGKRHRPM